MKKYEENKLSTSNKEEIINNSDEFNFILNRSENVIKINHINNKVKKINYTYSSKENYSDEILYYLTQKVDKINQYKYNHSLNNSNNNFKIYNINYKTDIDVFYEYELTKKELYNHKHAFNVHEHRKIPYEEENRQLNRRKFYNNNNIYQNKYHKYNYNNRRNASVDVYKSFNDEEEEKNINKVKLGGIPEFINNNRNEYKEKNLHIINDHFKDEVNRSMDDINIRGYPRIKKNNLFYNDEITSYNPFKNKK